jgi:hypothetical protein
LYFHSFYIYQHFVCARLRVSVKGFPAASP